MQTGRETSSWSGMHVGFPAQATKNREARHEADPRGCSQWLYQPAVRETQNLKFAVSMPKRPGAMAP
ncbi:hypothetical protein LMG23992_00981 [Cupriavidus laharis]|uniref:Uncharacterized protein n=1 Tax=Cupriavidus laharis TaxID=151654 RepID=A0ABN7Y3T1_9BURK|nr:hypothetical protein LMG23992_00981 [Cupriavidus laharis]